MRKFPWRKVWRCECGYEVHVPLGDPWFIRRKVCGGCGERFQKGLAIYMEDYRVEWRRERFVYHGQLLKPWTWFKWSVEIHPDDLEETDGDG